MHWSSFNALWDWVKKAKKRTGFKSWPVGRNSSVEGPAKISKFAFCKKNKNKSLHTCSRKKGKLYRNLQKPSTWPFLRKPQMSFCRFLSHSIIVLFQFVQGTLNCRQQPSLVPKLIFIIDHKLIKCMLLYMLYSLFPSTAFCRNLCCENCVKVKALRVKGNCIFAELIFFFSISTTSLKRINERIKTFVKSRDQCKHLKRRSRRWGDAQILETLK